MSADNSDSVKWRYPPSKVGECAVCGRPLYTTSTLPPHFESLTNALYVNDGDMEMAVVCTPFHNRIVAGEIAPGDCLASFLNTHPDWQVGS